MGECDFSRLSGKSEAHNQGHVVARIALMNRIVDSETWRNKKHAILTAAGLLDKAEATAQAVAKLKAIIGEDAYLGIVNDAYAGIIGEKKTIAVDEKHAQEVVEKYEAACDALEAFDKDFGVVSNRFSAPIIHYVRNELCLPWAWVAIELTEDFVVGVQGYVLGVQMTKQLWYEPLDPPAPDLELSFRTQEGETISETANRLIDEVQNALSRLSSAREPMSLPKGKSYSQNNVERYVDWYYRSHIEKESIRSISRDPRDGETERDRKHIRHGIKQAKGLLSIASWFWNEIEDSEIEDLTEGFWYESE